MLEGGEGIGDLCGLIDGGFVLYYPTWICIFFLPVPIRLSFSMFVFPTCGWACISKAEKND